MDNVDNFTSCALFMQGLPRNFSTNTQLAAIASLLEDTVPEEIISPDDDKYMKQTTKKTLITSRKTTKTQYIYKCVGKRYNKYSKLHRPPIPRKQQLGSHNKKSPKTQTPFPIESRESVTTTITSSSKPKTTLVGEATLYLNMWKL
jgi:hypothetical protein